MILLSFIILIILVAFIFLSKMDSFIDMFMYPHLIPSIIISSLLQWQPVKSHFLPTSPVIVNNKYDTNKIISTLKYRE